MATFNGEEFIHQQLASILGQLNENDEVVVSDDGSTDGTLTIIRSFEDDRIKLFRNPNKRSPILNFQNTLLHAQGEYIFLADQDDIWFPEKVEQVLKTLQTYDLVVHDCKLTYEKSAIKSHFKIVNSRKGLFRNIIKNTFSGNCMAFNRNLLNYALPSPEDIPMHDMWIGLVATLYGKVHFLNRELSVWRQYDGSFLKKFRSNNPVSLKLKYRVILIKNLVNLVVAKGLYGGRKRQSV